MGSQIHWVRNLYWSETYLGINNGQTGHHIHQDQVDQEKEHQEDKDGRRDSGGVFSIDNFADRWIVELPSGHHDDLGDRRPEVPPITSDLNTISTEKFVMKNNKF